MKTLATGILLLCLSPATSAPLTRSAVLLYDGERPVGSGVVVSHKGKSVVLTCSHVADAFRNIAGEKATYKRVTLKTRTGRVISVRLGTVAHQSPHPDVDLAVIEADDGEGLQPLPLLPAKDTLAPGDDCWYCGLGMGIPWNLIKTIVNDPDDGGSVRVNGAGWFGHSGSGLLVLRGGKLHVAGVVHATRGLDNIFRQPVMVVPHKAIHSYLDSLPEAKK